MKVKLLFIFALLLTAVTGARADDSGSCGTNVSYSYVESTHTLTISGTGAMTDYDDPSERPWNSYVEEIETVIIEDGVTGIGNYAFLGCTGLTTVTIPASVKSIGDSAFNYCTGLTTITIGSGVTYIGFDAFFDCTKVEIVYCNADPIKLTWEDYYCDDFKKDGSTIIHVADADPWIAKFTDVVNGTFIDTPYVPLTWNYDAATKTLTFSGTVIPSYEDLEERPWKDYAEVVEKIVISDDVTRIGNRAFEGCSDLTTVTIGSGVTYIGSDAFFVCTKVEVVYCNADPEELKWDENGCDDFKEDGSTIIHVADAAPWIAKFTGVVHGTFSDTPYAPLTWNYDVVTKTLTFSGTVIPSYEDLEERPWKDYVEVVEKIVISDDVTRIGYVAFQCCSDLTTVTIGSGVTYIGSDAFYDCTAVTDVYCNADPLKLTWDEAGCDDFKEDGSTIIHVADADPWYTKFGGEVHGIFRDPSTVPLTWNYDAGTKTLTFSGTEAIPSCNTQDERPWKDYVEVVENIIINEGVRGIGNYAFEVCTGLTTITIPASVTSIGKYAFNYCSGLTTITIPASVTSIGYAAFAGCSNLATMTVDAGNTKYDSRNGCNAIIEKESNTLIAGCKNTIIPDDVTNIDNNAFGRCISLTTVTIPAGVTNIGGHAFSGCSGLKTVTIGNGVTYIGYDAFYDCTAVTDVYCYADPDALTWDESGCNDFMYDGSTKCHVTDATKFEEKWSTGDYEVDVNVDFVGDLAPQAKTKAAGEEYWSSYYNSAAHLKADDNTTVYKATLSGTTVTLTEITDKVITAGQAVLLKTTTDAVKLTPCADASTDDYSGNDLEGVDAETAKESGSDYYVLSYKDSKLSFYKYSGTTLGANKAFFKIPANSSREFLDILGEVTGVDGRCKMEDGRSDVYYDLNGRRVMNPTKKGVYINNGRKVVIK